MEVINGIIYSHMNLIKKAIISLPDTKELLQKSLNNKYKHELKEYFSPPGRKSTYAYDMVQCLCVCNSHFWHLLLWHYWANIEPNLTWMVIGWALCKFILLVAVALKSRSRLSVVTKVCSFFSSVLIRKIAWHHHIINT